METDSLISMHDTIVSSQNSQGFNIWLIIAIIEAIVIIILLLRKKDDSNFHSIKKKVLAEGNVDFSDILNSSFNANSLYKELLAACHPDKYTTDPEKHAIACDISSRLSLNKHSVKALRVLQEEAIQKLGINS
ncbi:MAG: hypothetical protein J6V75_04515 [Bacteroidaceae bacterium]|nr:hypothetical protein [Bacteroidaceae bacterium]